VVVTGSRIAAEDNEGNVPVLVLQEEQLTAHGADSLGEVLQTLPQNTGAPLNTNVNNGGYGSTRVALRGLGSQRTLVLLNGRRLPNGGIGADASVDIDSLPLSMVERVEVLTTGASAVYGADAVGGVINVITRTDFKGTQIGVQSAVSERGDGAVRRVQLLVGGDLQSGQWMFGGDHVDQNGVSMNRREYSAVPLAVASADGTRVASGSFSIPDGRFMVRPGNRLGLPPGPYTRVAGSSQQTANDWRRATAADTFNFAPYTYLQTPNDRTSFWLTGRQPVTNSVEAFVEGQIGRRRSSQSLAPAPFMLPSNAAPLLADGTPYIPATNYYNPFGVNVTTGARRLVELADRGYEQHINVWRALAGLRGLLGNWKWEASAALSDSDAVTRERGLPVAERFVTGLGPSGPDDTGRIVCGTPDIATGIVPQGAIVAGCVPLNLFGGAGSITPEQREYMSGPLEDHGDNSQRLIDINLTGTWGRLPAGNIQWAVGGEYRRESGAYRYDAQRLSGAVGDGLGADVPGGRFSAREVYLETQLPLLADGNGVRTVDATLGGRWSDFSSFGSHASWRSGLRWNVSASWIVRADYATLFRAPALNELYEAQVTNLGFAPFDPCGHAPTSMQQINCSGSGVPGGSYVQVPTDSALLSQGGNTRLQPEEGHSFDVGVEFRSNAWRTTVDYFEARLNGFIGRYDPTEILDECATRGVRQACAKISRFADGSVRSIDVRRSNFGSVTLRGFDLTTALDRTTNVGDWGVQLTTTHLAAYDTDTFDGSRISHDVGRTNRGLILPRWRGLGTLHWSRNRWQARYSVQWIGALSDCSLALDTSRYCGNVPPVHYHDIETSYEWHGATLRAGASNVTDRRPPFLNQEGNTSPATYRLLGREYFLQASYKMR